MSELEFLNASDNAGSKKPPKPILFLLYFTGGTAAVITLISVPFISPAFRRKCLPYVPATSTQVSNVFSSLKKRSGTFVDLGSGDGRIVHTAAALGFEATGIELNYWLVFYSRIASYLKGCSSNAKFYRKDLWSFDLKPFSNVVIFGAENMMEDMEKKCIKELSDDSVIVTCRFPLPNLKPIEVIGEGIDSVWKYRINRTK